MCGIFGYMGEYKEDLSAFLVSSLAKLEYRGYDSAGIAIFDNGRPEIVKSVGEIKNLQEKLDNRKIGGSLGIGHTRWATHGGVTVKNTHPHTDCRGDTVVVHNGIIENFEELKKKLISSGHKFSSETDTEIFPHLVEEMLHDCAKFPEAVRLSFNQLTGLNAIVAANKDFLIGFRSGSPLVAGRGLNAFFISSDIPALLSETKRVVLLNEDEGIVISNNEILIVDAKTGKIKKAKEKLFNIDESLAKKGSFPHFLLKEIYEEPTAVAAVANNNKYDIDKAVSLINSAYGTYFTACGTAAYSGLAATYMFAEIAKRHVNFTVGSEFPYFEDFLVKKSLLIAASQSGETMDTLEAVRAAKRHGSKVLALVNMEGSSLTRLADYTILLKAGAERAVVSTKAYVAKLTTFLLFAFTLANKYRQGIILLQDVSRKMTNMLKSKATKQIKVLADKLKKSEHIYIIGRGVNYATALEGALKIKEASYIHAEAFAGGELKHGVIALIEKGTPCIVIVAEDHAKSAIISNAMELSARGGYIIGISPTREKVFDFWIPVPDVSFASPIVNVIPLQLLAYNLAILKGYNPDKPRNLAKSVTVK